MLFVFGCHDSVLCVIRPRLLVSFEGFLVCGSDFLNNLTKHKNQTKMCMECASECFQSVCYMKNVAANQICTKTHKYHHYHIFQCHCEVILNETFAPNRKSLPSAARENMVLAKTSVFSIFFKKTFYERQQIYVLI